MLKLRKNKKGFTLVELIVVIAIMAVLAGTIAGVTISQLNKQKNNSALSEVKTLMSDFQTFLLTYDKKDDITKSQADATAAVTAFATEAKSASGESVFAENAAGAVAGNHKFFYTVTYTAATESTTATVKYKFYASRAGSTGPVPEIEWTFSSTDI